MWTLFDPHDTPELTELWGEEFSNKYIEYENEFKNNPKKFNGNTRTFPIVELVTKILESYIKEGMPFIFFKDTVNREHKYEKELGLIRHPNLCVSGDTNILTKEYGNTPIGNLIEKGIKEATCWNGEEWSTTELFKTNESDTLCLITTSKDSIKCTRYHKFWIKDEDGNSVKKEAERLNIGDVIIDYTTIDKDGNITKHTNVKVIEISMNYSKGPTYCGREPKRNMLIFNGILTGNCMEVFQPNDENSTFVCNLAALNMARLVTKDNLIETSQIAVRALDNIIDVTTYNSDRAKNRQLLVRSIALGSIGEAERMATLNIHYGSKEHEEWLHDTYGTVRKTVDEYSALLAKEKGGCGIDPNIRNAYRLAIAPNTASGLLAGSTASCEPVYDRLYAENSKVGTYKMIAPNLNINNISHYKNAYECNQADLIKMTGIRQKYIDMGISHSLYIDPTADYNGKPFTPIDLLKLILLAHKEGVKTLYYFRAKARKNSDVIENGESVVCENCAN